MKIDPSIIAALKMLAASGDAPQQAARQKRHDRQTTNQIETALHLLEDEIERIVPRQITTITKTPDGKTVETKQDNPLFSQVLLLAAIQKVTKQQEDPEYKSSLEEGFPQGW